MNSLKRIFISMKSQIDHVADDFENHEALADIAIKELHETACRTRLHLHRVSKMSEQYNKQLQELQTQTALWSGRAIKAKDDENKALQCVKRLRQVQLQISSLEEQQLESSAQESKIRDDLNMLQDQLQTLRNKKEILAARQNRSTVKDVLYDPQAGSFQEAKNVFDRWEGSVVSTEFDTVEPIVESDLLAEEFAQEEDKLALKKMLTELTKKSSQDK